MHLTLPSRRSFNKLCECKTSSILTSKMFSQLNYSGLFCCYIWRRCCLWRSLPLHCKMFTFVFINVFTCFLTSFQVYKAYTSFNAQVGLEEKFGKDRVFNTPLCEQVFLFFLKTKVNQPVAGNCWIRHWPLGCRCQCNCWDSVCGLYIPCIWPGFQSHIFRNGLLIYSLHLTRL